MKPDLSIIIVNFNTKDLIKDCVESIRKNCSLNVEIIVVDNNSQDGSVEAIMKLGVVAIFNKGNFGFAKANNQGIKIAKSEYVFLLNSDTLIKKGSLEKILTFAKAHPDAGVVGPRLFFKDGSLQNSCLRFPTIGNAIKEYWFGEKGLFDKYAPKGKSPVVVDSLVGAAFLMTPAALKKVGGLDERYFFYFEDIDYCRKVKRAGLKVYYLPEAEIIHFEGASGKKIAKPKDQWRRLIPSSKIYHGTLKHYILTLIILIGQKWAKLYGHIQKN